MLMPAHRCSKCSRLITGRCQHCETTRDRARLSAAQRGYCSERWRSFRAIVLERRPVCAGCARVGVVRAATVVDHIVPVSGPDDPTFLRFDAVQPLCVACHGKKTATEDSTFARRR